MNFSKFEFRRWSTLALLAAAPSQAKIVIDISSKESFEIPRSQIKTYIQVQSIEQNLKPIAPVKPGALSDEELLTVPERYLSPELKSRQRALKAKTKAAPSKSLVFDTPTKKKARDVVTIKNKANNKLQDIRIDEAIWVPPTTGSKEVTILAPRKLLPDVEILQEESVQGSKSVMVEINPGETRELDEVFKKGKTTDPQRTPLLPAYKSYSQGDYASAITQALALLDDKKNDLDIRNLARFVAAHALYRSGFYASTLPLLNELVTTKWRRSALGISALAIEKTRDDAAANRILSKVSLSQMPESIRPVFSFHMGRILLSTGAGPAAIAAFERIPAGHVRYPEAQYYIGVIKSSEIKGGTGADWDKEGSAVFEARSHYETALVAARTQSASDLRDLINLSLARLAYQSQQFNRAVFHYDEVGRESPFMREALFETAWSLYRIGEFNRSLGKLHPLGSAYFEARDLPELWILRSLNYLKLCRFDEANRASNTFDELSKNLEQELKEAVKGLNKGTIAENIDFASFEIPEWVKGVLASDAIIIKDQNRSLLLENERKRIGMLRQNPRIKDAELKNDVASALEDSLLQRRRDIASALKPYLTNRLNDLSAEYRSQRDRLQLLRFEIYSQATKFPDAVNRPQAKRLIAKSEYLPGVFLKGHEILWKFSGEYWLDEITGYDYFIPTECAEKKL